MRGATAPPAALLEQAGNGDRRALGRLLSMVEGGGAAADEVATLAHPRAGNAFVVGMTGAPGAGKSTLTGRLTAALSEGGRRVAVLAIDPTSPLSGGAILGDRIRMDGVVSDQVFIRSMATRGHHGGLSLAAPGMLRVFDAAGIDLVLVETVGVGQVEIEVVGTADTTVVVVTPGWGDAIQANKAGLLELADIFVVNKADRPGASDARRDLEYMLDLGPAAHDPSRWRAPIVSTTATEGDGIAELAAAIERHRGWMTEHGELDRRRAHRLRDEVRSHAMALFADATDERLASAQGVALLDEVVQRRLTPAAAARTLLPTD
ncbi:MAG: methylmalonyl Co-A mutase-associated GTPase MeaB [Acidimicrobiales bacterium]